MWAVIKIDKKKFFSFKQDLNIKFGSGAEVYRPKLLINKFKKNKLYKKEFDLLGDYLFCYVKKKFFLQSAEHWENNFYE